MSLSNKTDNYSRNGMAYNSMLCTSACSVILLHCMLRCNELKYSIRDFMYMYMYMYRTVLSRQPTDCITDVRQYLATSITPVTVCPCTIVRLKSFIIIAEQATNKVNNALRLSVRCRHINGWRVVNDYHLFIAYNPIYYKSPLTIKLLCLIHTFQYAIKLHLLTESFIAENTKKKKPRTHLLCLLMNSFFIMFQSLAVGRFMFIILPKSFRYAISFIFFVDFQYKYVTDTRLVLH